MKPAWPITGRGLTLAGMALPVVLSLALSTAPATGLAQVYKYVDDDGVTHLTDRPPDEERHRARNIGCYGICRTGVDWHTTPLVNGKFSEEITEAARVYGVDRALVRAVMHAESWFNPEAISHKGAEGLMQLMPATQARFGVDDAFDPIDNITGGVAYLSWLLEKFDRDIDLAVAAYNAGENAVNRHGGIPPFEETREYVRRVGILYGRYNGGR